MDDVLRVGLVGCGYWGKKHLRVLNELPGCEVVALCEPSAKTLESVPRGYLPAMVTGDYEAFLKSGLDAVVIATPARTHYPLAMQALEAEKHVLIEKPFTTRTSDALALIGAAERRGLTLMVGHTYVYHPAVAYLKSIVDSGTLGQLAYVHMARLNFGLLQPDVDVLWDLAPHDVSILMHILGQEPLVGGARGTSAVTPERYEVAHVDLEFMDGLLAHVHVSWLEPTKVRRITLIGTERIAVYNDVAPDDTIRIYDKSIRMEPSELIPGRMSAKYLHGDTTIPFLAEIEPLKAEISHFMECARTGARPISGGWEGMQVVRVLESVARSLYNGGTMESVPQDLLLSRHDQVSSPQMNWAFR
jgi:predicted dehydrogenase